MFYSKDDLKKAKATVIACPNCHAQYLAGEIFMPGAVIGKPVEVVKDALGQIIYVDYQKKANEPCLTEQFTCEYCGKPFVINADFDAKAAKEAPEKDFSSPYVSLFD